MDEEVEIDPLSKIRLDLDVKTNDWRMWCRLCAKNDKNTIMLCKDEGEEDPICDMINSVKSNISSVIKAIEHYFSIDFLQTDNFPKHLCYECNSLIGTLIKFTKRVDRVQDIFQHLLKMESTGNVDLAEIRETFGLDVKATSSFNKMFNDINMDNMDLSLDIQKESCYGIELNESDRESDENMSMPDIQKESELNDIEKYVDEGTKIGVDNNELEEDISIPDIQNETCKENELNDIEKYIDEIAEIFVNNRELEQDSGGIENNVLNCEHCEKIFTGAHEYQNHKRNDHPEGTGRSKSKVKKLVKCDYCDECFKTKGQKTNHIKTEHNEIRPFTCEECGVSFKTKLALKAHMLTHTDNAPFQCEICNKNFKTHSILKVNKTEGFLKK